MTTAHSDSNPFSGRMETALRESEERFRLINDHAHDAIFYLDLNGEIQWASRQATVMTGRPMAELVHGSFMKLLTPQAAVLAEGRLASIRRGESVPPIAEFELLRPDGSRTWVEANATSVQQDGNVIGRLVVFRDITERKKSEAQQRQLLSELAQSKAHFEKIFHATPSAIGISTVAEGRFIDVNDSLVRLTGYAREELISHTTLELNLWADPSERARIVQEIVEHGSLHNREGRLRMKSGDIRDVIVSVEQIQIGSEACLIYIAHDITARKQAEKALRESEQRMRAILDGALDAVVGMDTQGVITAWNPRAEAIFGWSRQEAIGRNLAETIIPLHYRSAHQRGLRRFLADGDGPLLNRRIEVTALRRDGTEFPVELAVSPLKVGESYLFNAFIADITERKRVEEALKMQSRVLESMGEGVSLADENGFIRYTNPAKDAMFGYQRGELIGKHVTILNAYPSEENARIVGNIIDQLKTKGAWSGEFSNRKKDGTPFTTFAQITALEISNKKYWVSVQEDITQRKQADKALRESEAFMNRVLESSPDCIKVLDMEGRLLFMNRGGQQSLEICDIASFLNSQWLEFWKGEDKERAHAAVEAARTGNIGRFIGFRPTTTGKPKWWDVSITPLLDASGTPDRLLSISRDITERKQAEETWQALLEGTASVTGEQFFPALVRSIAKALGVRYAFVTELLGGERPRLRILAIWMGDRFGSPIEYDLVHTPCENVIRQGTAYYPASVQELFPKDKDLVALEAVSYLGIALVASSGKTIGHLCILDDKPLPDEHRIAPLLKVFASRAAAELERKRLVEKLLLSREIIANAHDPISIMDLQGRFTYQNSAHAFLVGFSDDELLGKTPAMFLGEEAFASICQDLVRTQSYHGELIARTKEEVSKDLELSVFTIKDAAEKPVCFVAIKRDITERKRAEAALHASEQALRTVLKEREQFSQDLHDGLIQSLYAMGMSMEECQRLAEEDPQKAKLKLGQAIADLNAVIREVRSHLAEDLDSTPLGAAQFRTELTRVARTMERATTLPFRLKVEARAAECLTAEERREILYIAQEAMSNCLRHSGASIAQVSLRLQNEQVRLEVKDDGVGFDTKMLNGEHRGLRNMTGRAARISAKLEIVPAHPRGTCLTLDVPLKRSQGDHP